MEPNEPIFKILDQYLDKLDTVTISQSGFLKTFYDKERYETIFMYSFRKYRAAVYHSNLISKFLKEYEEYAQTNPLREIKDDETFTINLCYTADHFAFELSAFLESLNSSVDFLATNCSFHLPGIKCRSISTLMKLAKDGNKRDPIFDVIRQNQEWLEELRIYRHHFVHFRFISTSCGYKRQVIKGVQKIIIYRFFWLSLSRMLAPCLFCSSLQNLSLGKQIYLFRFWLNTFEQVFSAAGIRPRLLP